MLLLPVNISFYVVCMFPSWHVYNLCVCVYNRLVPLVFLFYYFIFLDMSNSASDKVSHANLNNPLGKIIK